MKRKNIITIIVTFIFMLILLQNRVFADNVTIEPNLETIEKGEIFSIYINSNNLNIAALTMQIYFDSSKIEYVKQDENTNLLENSVIYTWVDETGGKEKKTTSQIIELKFRAKEAGSTTISANGEFYNSEGQNIEMEIQNAQIQIEETTKLQEEIEKQNSDISTDNAYLEILRLDKEGITPNFNKEITQYYITVDNLTNNLQVTAIPENREANVQIKGNNNLTNGINKIEIIVTPKYNTKKQTYTINVTKTQNIEASNANLENLAIENTVLTPEFYSNILNYKAEVSNDTNKLNILAIPEKTTSQVKIEGQNNLKQGQNTVIITVTAENKITTQEYIIEVYKRNAQEEIENEKQQEEKIELANELIEEKEETIENNQINSIEKSKSETKESTNKKSIIIIISIPLIIILFTILFIKRKNKL